jgi:hypothetical protein
VFTGLLCSSGAALGFRARLARGFGAALAVAVAAASHTATALAAPPTVTTGPAKVAPDRSVTLTGTISTNSDNGARWHFEFVSDTEWKHRPGRYTGEWNPGSIDGKQTSSVSQVIPDFDPGTLYHYALVAWNGDTTGVVEGRGMTFLTPGQGPNSGGQAHKPIGSGAPNPPPGAPPPPKEPCTIASEVGTFELGATIFSGGANTNFTAEIAHKADGKFEASVQNTAGLSAEPGTGFEANGGSATAGGGGESVDLGLKGGLKIHGVQGTTYDAGSEDEADQIVGARLDEILRDVPYFGWFAERSNYSLGPPTKAVRGGDAGLDIDATLGLTSLGKAKASGAFEAFTREEADATTATFTQYLGLKLSGQGGVDGLGHLKAEGKVEAGITTDGASGAPVRATVSIRYGGKLSGAPDVTLKDPKNLYSSLTKAVASGESNTGTETVITLTLDLHPPENLQALRAFISGGSGSLASRGRTLFDLAARDGKVTKLVYDVTGYGTGGSVGVGAGARFGATAATSDTTSTLASADYYVPGSGFVTWAACQDEASKLPRP